jgi:hypothetical protein
MSLNAVAPQTQRSALVTAAPIDPRRSIIDQLAERFSAVQALAYRRNARKVTQALQTWFPLRADALGAEEKARQRLALIPGLRELSDQRDELHEAVFLRAKEPEIRLILAAMIDGIPSAKSQATPGYFDAAAFTLQHADEDAPEDSPGARLGFAGFSSAALFMMARRVMATHRFAPAPAELLEIARSARFEFWSARNSTARLIEFRLNAEEVLDALFPDDIEFDDVEESCQ